MPDSNGLQLPLISLWQFACAVEYTW